MNVSLRFVLFVLLATVSYTSSAQQNDLQVKSPGIILSSATKKASAEALESNRVKFVFEAIQRSDKSALDSLMRQSDFYRHNDMGETALTQAILNQDPLMVAYLENSAVINLKNRSGETPLSLAIKGGNKEIIDIVLSRSKASYKNEEGDSPLMLAICKGDLELMQKLIDRGADVNRWSNGITPLTKAGALNAVPAMALLLKNGADPSKRNEDGTIPLATAVFQNNEIIARILLGKSKNPEKDANWSTLTGEPLIHMATRHNNVNLVKILSQYGASVTNTDVLGNTPLHIAVEKSNMAMVEILLQNGADPNESNLLGYTPAMQAASSGNQILSTGMTVRQD